MKCKTTIRQRLTATMTLLGLLIVVAGVSGLYGMSRVHAAMADIETNIMPSMTAIADTQLALCRARLVLDRVAMHPELPEVDKLLARAANFATLSDQAWGRYLALPQDAEEAQLAGEVDATRKQFLEQALLPLVERLKARDGAGADRIIMTRMQPLFTRFSDSAAKLTEFQERSNRQHSLESQASYSTLRWVTAGAIGVGVVLIALASLALARAILRPIQQAIAHFDSIADGNLSNPIPTGGHDEMARLMRGLAGMQARLASTVGKVRDGAAAIATATAEIATGNADLSRRTEQQAASLEEAAASLEQLTAAVKHNADHARQSQQLASAASDVAHKGGQIVSGVVNTMDTIRGSSSRIAEITGVIDGIAFQTNILALNAAVEAARAGEQGRGFAVVAGEVRNLAQRSAVAARDIKQLIADSTAQVDSGSKLVEQAGVTMEQIVASIRQVADSMSAISAAGQEQEVGIQQINRTVAELDGATQQNSALVEQAAAASESLRDQAGVLASAVGAFRLGTRPLLA
ncbi:methyl-accepting chemotaxis protein [Duganella radicis]|uniref:HAMP domain-containing protein n=1 Tax=Duganella radicis TaxID=551988 RepID=A0A6L6PSZ8_9BURK|nr:methyl-accepting chemotaxis protein [Duganella radicis]MTV41771.1 HAMP domain-containing protein [Duganella radicis]